MEMHEWRGGWDRAQEATEALKVALEGLGVPEGQTVRLRPTVSGRGTPWVDVGMVPAHVAVRIAEAVVAGAP